MREKISKIEARHSSLLKELKEIHQGRQSQQTPAEIEKLKVSMIALEEVCFYQEAIFPTDSAPISTFYRNYEKNVVK